MATDNIAYSNAFTESADRYSDDLDSAAGFGTDTEPDNAESPRPLQQRRCPRLLPELIRRVVRQAVRYCRCDPQNPHDPMLCRCRPLDRRAVSSFLTINSDWFIASLEVLYCHILLSDRMFWALLESPRAGIYASKVRHLALGVTISERGLDKVALLLRRHFAFGGKNDIEGPFNDDWTGSFLRTLTFARGFGPKATRNPEACTEILRVASQQCRVTHLAILVPDAIPDGLLASVLPSWSSLSFLSLAAPKTDSGAELVFPTVLRSGGGALRHLHLQDGKERPVCGADLELLFGGSNDDHVISGTLESLRLNLQTAVAQDPPPSLSRATSRLKSLEIDRTVPAVSNISDAWLARLAPHGTLTRLHLKAADLFTAHASFCALLERNPNLEDLELDSCWFKREELAASELSASCPKTLKRLAFLEAAGTLPAIPRALFDNQTRLVILVVKPSFFRWWFPRPLAPPSTLTCIELRRVSKELGTTSWEAVGDALLTVSGFKVLRCTMVYEIMGRMVKRLREARPGLVVAEGLLG